MLIVHRDWKWHIRSRWVLKCLQNQVNQFRQNWANLGPKRGGGDLVLDYEVSEMGEGLVIEDGGAVHPTILNHWGSHRKSKVRVLNSQGGKLVGMYIAILTGVALDPGHLQVRVVSTQ